MGLRERLQRLGVIGGAGRTTGRPTSSNGASSFHLGWSVPTPGNGISVTLEVLEPPVVPELYFWAVQVDVADGRGQRPAGGAHLGLQWHPGYPGSTAVNWGGYGPTGAELDGTSSALPSATGNPNTRDLRWTAGRPYRLSVDQVGGPDGPGGAYRWRGSVEDLSSGSLTVVRDLFLAGDRVVGATMWSEVFAPCDAPSVTVRWSEPVVRAGGVGVPVERVSVNYQTHPAGGCANTDSSVDDRGLVQRTATPRITVQGTQLGVPQGPAPSR